MIDHRGPKLAERLIVCSYPKAANTVSLLGTRHAGRNSDLLIGLASTAFQTLEHRVYGATRLSIVETANGQQSMTN